MPRGSAMPDALGTVKTMTMPAMSHAGDKESILFRVARSLPKLRNKDAGR
jgi:hypothetical protein